MIEKTIQLLGWDASPVFTMIKYWFPLIATTILFFVIGRYWKSRQVKLSGDHHQKHQNKMSRRQKTLLWLIIITNVLILNASDLGIHLALTSDQVLATTLIITVILACLFQFETGK
ncbi:MAG TPA: hypothetical protein VNQ79_03260 [Blastocatellia bacterium]|nr:hypothetical protein [Blastocatellia bacterium]